VALDLVYRLGNGSVAAQVSQPVGIKVGHPDGAYDSLLNQSLQGPPGAVVVPHLLVEKDHVDILQPQFLQGAQNGVPCFDFSKILHPHFGGDKDLVPGQAAGSKGTAHGFLIEVGRGGINEPVSLLKRLQNRLLAEGLICNLKYAEPFQGERFSVV